MYPAAGHVMAGGLRIISGSGVRCIVSKGPKCGFPSRINFKKCREEVASALGDFGGRWCGGGYVEPDALREWKVGIFKIVDQRIKFYSQNTNLLPPKPKSTFRHFKQGIQDFHGKNVLVPAGRAADGVVVVWRLRCVDTLRRELGGARAYKETSEEEKSVVNGHCGRLALKFSVCVRERQGGLPAVYWLPKLHKTPCRARFIANSSSCTTTGLSKLLTSCLTAVGDHVIRYCEKVYGGSGENLFWSIGGFGEVLNKLKSRGFRATSLSTYDFSTLCAALPRGLVEEGLVDLIEWTFGGEGSPYIACNERRAFFTSEDTKRYKLWSCQNVCGALVYLLDNIYNGFGTRLYRQIVGVPVGAGCAPLVAGLFLFCYERDFMTSLSDVKKAEIVEAFKSTSRYLDDLLNIDNPCFGGVVGRVCPPGLRLGKASAADAEAPFLDLHLSISNGFVSSKVCDKRDDFDFDIVNFPFLDGDVPRSASCGVYISQLIRFAGVSSRVVDFNARNKSLAAGLLQRGYRYHGLRKTFSKFYRRHCGLVSGFGVGLKTLLRRGLSEPEFYGDLVCGFGEVVGRVGFSGRFRKIIVR